MQPALIVSIHDVSPQTYDIVRVMELELRSLGVDKLSHLLIPDHHHKGRFADHPALLSWLRDQQGAGQELVLHGYYHLRERPTDRRESLLDKLITRSYTAGEGEFHDIPLSRAGECLNRGLELFREAKLTAPTGFIAPARLLGPEGEQAVRQAGFRYTTRLGYLRDFQADQDYAAQSLCWSVRSAWRRQASLRWNDHLLARESRSPLVRIGLHPVDYRHPQIWRQIRRLISRALESRPACTYAEFCRG